MGLDVTGRYSYPPPDPEWLALRREESLEPDLPIIDAHHHIWVERGHSYLVEDLVTDLRSGHNVVATVAVQSHHGYRTDGPEAFRCVGETERLQAAADAAQPSSVAVRPCAAIVGYADLTDEMTLESVLESHLAAAPARFRGIRHGVARDTHFPRGIVLRPARAGLLADPAYRRGLAVLARRNLSYDAMLYHEQIVDLGEAARAIPNLRIVLNHLGCVIGVGPYRGRERETITHWRENMAALAECPNVTVKLGGLGMIICGAEWHEAAVPPTSMELAKAWRPFIETCIELFGAERCMFESNFPVDKAMYSYVTLWNAFKRLTISASADERRCLFHDTAAEFYGITQHGHTGRAEQLFLQARAQEDDHAARSARPLATALHTGDIRDHA